MPIHFSPLESKNRSATVAALMGVARQVVSPNRKTVGFKMTLALFLLLLDLKSVTAEALPKTEVWFPGLLRVDGTELFLREHRKKIRIFDISGSSIREYSPPQGFQIKAFGVTDAEIHLSVYGEEETAFFRVDRATGKVLEQSDQYCLFIAADAKYSWAHPHKPARQVSACEP